MKIKAFTVTEVLLTLAIIGVLTSVTIPSLMAQNHAKKHQTMTKKAIYTLQTAVDAKFEQSTRKADDFAGFFTWLEDEGSIATRDDNPEDTIRLTKSDGNRAQTADGIIFRAYNIDYSTDHKHHVACSFEVDLNGMEAPTQKAFDQTLSNTERENEDIIYLELDTHGTIRPTVNGTNNNAMRYFDLSNFGL